jgi:hypothetical protein
VDGAKQIAIGKQDGFVLLLDAATGEPRERILIGEPITALRIVGSGPGARLAIGTAQRVELRDMGGKLLASEPVPCARLEALDAAHVVCLTPDVRAVAFDLSRVR